MTGTANGHARRSGTPGELSYLESFRCMPEEQGSAHTCEGPLFLTTCGGSARYCT